jgi:hypothetical protein
VHAAIKEIAIRYLQVSGAFDKEVVLRESSFSTMAASIRRDFILAAIQAEPRYQVFPVSARFFHRRSKLHNPQGYVVEIMPGSCLTMGKGNKTAGYATVEVRNGRSPLSTWR